MKLSTLLPLAAFSRAFVIVDEGILNKIAIETKEVSRSFWDKLPIKADILSHVEDIVDVAAFSENPFDKAVDTATGSDAFQCHSSMTAFNPQPWLDSAVVPFEDEVEVEDFDVLDFVENLPKKPRHPPRHRKRHHHHKPNMTIYEMISKSNYTKKLAKLINEFQDLVDILNSTSSNITLFAPTDAAFEKIPDHHKKPPKELIRNVLAYHISPDFYPAGRILVSLTIPSAYNEEHLGGNAQRLRIGFSLFKGLNINFLSKVVAANIFATNGVIHGVDHIILPPPAGWKIIELLPGEFSTLQLALTKTGLFDTIKHSPHTGGTLFAPSNMAFKKLGPKINAFLFSKHGEKYLRALLKYHIVANETLYSDAFYKAKDAPEPADNISGEEIPKGRFHVDLPTLLGGKSLSIDIARYGGFISMKINGFNSVAVEDGLAKDGVIHVVKNVLIPPKLVSDVSPQSKDLTVEELKERLDAHVEQNGWWEL